MRWVTNMPAIDVNTREFDRAVIEIEHEIKKANYEIVTVNTQNHLIESVKNMPHRTGNLRSAALPIWRNLGIPGRPLTKLEPGEKLVTIEKRGRRRTYKVRSAGEYEDKRLDLVNPSYSYRMYAAEWKEPYQRISINKAMKSGLLSVSQMQKVGKMLSSNAPFADIWSLIEDALSGSNSSLLKNNPGGHWRPYQFYFKGNRKKMSAPASQKWTWKNHHKRILEKHSGRDTAA